MSTKRKLPRHVDGRLMVGRIPLPRFLMILPFLLAIGIGTMLFMTNIKAHPLILVGGVTSIGIIVGAFSEFNLGETGFDILKDMIKYNREGDKCYERSCIDIANSKRYIRNKIQRSEEGCREATSTN